jgi:hypothetical protein
MADQSHRDEMNAAIRAQRERQAVPRSIATTPETRPELEPPQPERRRRLLGRRRSK